MDQSRVPDHQNPAVAGRALADPAVAALAANGAPVIAAAHTPPRIIYCNAEALAFFGANDAESLSKKLLSGGDQGARRLTELAAALRLDAPARLERLRFTIGRRSETLTCLCRRVGGQPALLIVAALGARAAQNAEPRILPEPTAAASADLVAPPVEVVSPEQASPQPAAAANLEGDRPAPPAPDTQEQEAGVAPAAASEKPTVGGGDPIANEPARERSLAETEYELARRFPNAPTVRFLWKSDAAGLLHDVTGQLCEVVGCDSGALLGQNFAAHARNIGADPEGRMTQALARRETWSGMQLLWPIAHSQAAAPVTLGAVPAFNKAREFEGFRGFGVIHIQRLEPCVRTKPDDSALITEPRPDEAGDIRETATPSHDVNTTGEVEQEATREPPPSAMFANDENSPPEHSAGGSEATKEVAPGIESETDLPLTAPVASNVVPLRPLRPAIAAPADESASPEAPTSPMTLVPATVVDLTPAERQAFDDIARALGAEPQDEPASGPESQAQPAATTKPAIMDIGASVETQNQPLQPDAHALPPAAETESIDDTLADEDDILDHEAGAQPAHATPYNIVQVNSVEAAETAAARVAPAAPDTKAPSVEADAPLPGPLPPAEPDDAFHREVARNALSVLEKADFGVLVSRLETAIYLNRALLDMLGFPNIDLFHEAGGLDRMFHGRQAEDLTSAANGGAIPVIAASGDVIAVEGRLRTIEWEGGPATLMTFRKPNDADLLPHVRTLETELRHAETQNRELHAILDTATDGVAVLDQSGRILSLNRSAEALFGYEQNEVAGESFSILLAPESHVAAKDYFAGLKASGVASVLNDGREIQGRARQGGAIPLFMAIGPLGADAQKFCAVLRDMTQWKRAERELREARSEAEHASQMKSDFLAKISHEIRTPLNAILGFAEVIMEERFGPVGNERYKDYVKDIHASGNHVMSLVNDLLDLSKIEAGKLDLDFAAVDANRIVAECVSLMQPQATTERVILRMSLAPRLPKIIADERSLRQIMLNILSNAVKFNEPGGQVIVSTALADSGNAVLRVKDTGIGMTEAEVRLALEPFRQLQTARARKGTGLGLPLTRALVEANRASFSIRSRKKEGTLVEVSFPVTRVLTS